MARAAEQNLVAEGVMLLDWAMWCPAVAMATSVPDLWAITLVFCVLSVVLAMPFVSTERLLRLLYVASAILVIGGISTMIDPVLPFEGVPALLVQGAAAFAAPLRGHSLHVLDPAVARPPERHARGDACRQRRPSGVRAVPRA